MEDRARGRAYRQSVIVWRIVLEPIRTLSGEGFAKRAEWSQ